ncbi:glycosyl hydrolase family 17 protein [Kordia sp.]|uniref:glycosyl hydrolase family 17 protein n=1 Tax=Kordia sp. TaxID=1965332 RepID=UPI0025BD815A|nr:glycosyl hydrolase family 17 protein [Kordia sp.]MCH2194000.1 glycosyl hydrolase family 17 protein [Kordia sp.]
MVKVIVIGNEVDLASNNYTLAEVESAFNYAKTQLASYPKISNVPLTICMTGAGPMSPTWSTLLSIMQDYAFLTIYPWYGQKGNHEKNPSQFPMTPGNITGNMQYSYDNGMVQAINAGLEVVIAEIGWPSAGDDNADTNWKAEVTNFNATCKWINGSNIYNKSFITMWFEMFDEPWKTIEGAWGPYWGIYGSGTTPKIKTDSSKTKFTKCS